jgi:putative NADH-flavin reductase
MEKDIKIAIIGGTGKSGRYLVRHVVNQGIKVKMLVRNPARLDFNHPLVEVVNGDILDSGVVSELFKGCQAVISTLGLGLPPSEPTIFSKAAANILRSAEKNHVQRYIVTAGLNVDTIYDKKGPGTKAATEWMYRNFPLSTADRQKEYKMLSDSDINWIMVRLPMIDLTDRLCETEASNEDCMGDRVSAASLAGFLAGQLSDDTYLRTAPFLYNIINRQIPQI